MIVLLLLVGFLGGLVTGISPCILPVLPVIFASGAASGLDDAADRPDGESSPAQQATAATAADRLPVTVGGRVAPDPREGAPGGTATDPGPASADRVTAPRDRLAAARRRRRPFAVVGGLVLSFSLATLAGSWLLGALGLPFGLLRWVGIVVPSRCSASGSSFRRWATCSSARSRGSRPATRCARAEGSCSGVSLGLVFVPCAGPVLATITAVGGSHHVGWSAVLLTAAFAVGVAIPLLAFAVAGQYLAARMRSVRTHAATARRVIGAVLVVTALVLALGLTDGVQRAVPGYTDCPPEPHRGEPVGQPGPPAGPGGSGHRGPVRLHAVAARSCSAAGRRRRSPGSARWLQTPGDRPLTVAGLRGRVVLVDFWTYSCINCQRSLPHVEAWNAAYAADGLTVVGVHTPEFAFEHDRRQHHPGGGPARGALPDRRGQLLRHLGQLPELVLAGRVPHRRHRHRASRRLRRGRVRPDRDLHPPAAPGGTTRA